MSTTAQDVQGNSVSADAAVPEIASLFSGASDALTDGMVERLASTLANSLEVVDKLNEEHTRDAVLTLLDELSKLHRAGGLVAVFELIHLFNAIRAALTDSMVERLANFAESMVTNLANEEVAALAGDVHEAVVNAQAEVSAEPSSGGLIESLRLLSRPETQSALRFMISVSKQMQK